MKTINHPLFEFFAPALYIDATDPFYVFLMYKNTNPELTMNVQMFKYYLN